MQAMTDSWLLAAILCAVAAIGANAALYRWTAGRTPIVGRTAQLAIAALLIVATVVAASIRAPVPSREAHAIPHRVAWMAEAGKRLVENTDPPEAKVIITGALKPREASRTVERLLPPDRRDVVQVFYGTDRTRADKPNRISYGSDRAQRLELGRAFVTIPTAHQAPSSARQWAIKRAYLSVTRLDAAEEAKTHFAVSQIGSLTHGEMLKLVAEQLGASKDYKDHAIVFIHGYNNTFDHALYRTAQIAYDLGFDGATFMYSWPSGGSFTTYTYDRDSARQTVQYLRDFIEAAVMDSAAKTISLIAHGMGSQPLLSVLSDLRRTSPGEARIHQIILTAPDVDRDAFQILAGQIKGLSSGITLYASSSDLALGISRRFAGDIPRAGDVTDDGPAIVPGIDTIDISALNTGFFAMNHATYADQAALLRDIERRLRPGADPSHQRPPILQRIAGPSGTYWRYP